MLYFYITSYSLMLRTYRSHFQQLVSVAQLVERCGIAVSLIQVQSEGLLLHFSLLLAAGLLLSCLQAIALVENGHF